MKLGAEDKKKVVIMAVLLVIAVPLLIHSYGSLRPSSTAAAPVAPKTTPAPPTRTTQKKTGIPQVPEGTFDPTTLRTDILIASQKIQYQGGTRNIFKMYEPPAKIEPIGPVRPQPPPPVVQQEPVKPQIPLKFYGFANRPGEPKKAFLQSGENYFIASEGDVVDRRYKILKITNTFVLVEDVLNNYQQTINLTLPSTTG